MFRVITAFSVSLLLFSSTNVRAFQLSPDGTSFEKRLASQGQPTGQRLLGKLASFGVRNFGSPVHEEISNRALDCEGDAEICADPDWDPAQAYILAGVRWNDDPPFRFEQSFGKYVGCTPGQTVRLVVQPECWARVFVDGKKRAKRGEVLNAKSAPLLLRSHFGDMQFLHSMGGVDGESPEVTRARILMWSEFTWKVATQRIRGGEIVAKVNIAGMSDVFGTNGWSVQDLFTLGNPNIRKPAYLAAVAFGSLLHTVQDSFSRAHVSRRQPEYNASCQGSAGKHLAPGPIEEFHSYSHQDPELHSEADVRSAFSVHMSSGKPTSVDVGHILAEFYSRQADWSEVAPYLECIFRLDENPRPASPGNFAAR
jgi:hypothetical protein